jgi:endoglucanase
MAYVSRMRRTWLRCAVAAATCVVAACSSGPAGTGQASTGHASPGSHRQHRHTAAPRLHVSGNRLVNAHGRPVVLHGVNRSGTEFMCVQGHGIFDGPNGQAPVSAMKAWGVNAVRIPLNEACWNGAPYVNPAYSGANYQSAIRSYVNLLNANGMVAILDLHWTGGRYTGPSSACASAQARCLKPMPGAAQAVPFWTSVAQDFKGNGAVLFDLFNEPFPERAAHSDTAGWQCWLHGGSCPGISYQVAGMQTLVDTVRATGARNVILAAGLAYANDLSGWLAYEPTDPDHNLAASWHSYSFNVCSNLSCWTSLVAPVIARVPVVAGEIGENDCGSGYISELMSWLDSQSASYLAWAWNADFRCASGPSLITSYAGTPTPYGAGYQSHLLSLPH